MVFCWGIIGCVILTGEAVPREATFAPSPPETLLTYLVFGLPAPV